jgi:hypothetical protein
MEYLRLANKEARADRKALRAAKELAQHAKEAKVALDNAMIDQMMAEAKERADRAMEAATTGLVMGIVSGNVLASGGAWTITVPDEKGIAKKSDLIRLQIRHQEDAVEKAATHLAEADEAADASRKHKQAIRDAILKLLEIMAGIKPQV